MSRAFRLSHSALQTLHKCERMFQLDRILTTAVEKRDYPATVLGKAWGAGVASYCVSKDIDKALFTLWQNYSPRLEDDTRTQPVAANMLLASIPVLDMLLQDWEIVYFQDRPAVELSFRLNIDSKYYFVGYLDVVLRNKLTGRIAAFDAKSTALKLFDLSPVYQNSPQLIGYSIVLDQIVGEALAEYDVFYLSGQLGSGTGFEPIVKPYSFSKTLQDRLHWFIALGMDVKHLHEMAELGIYPQRGDSCLQYNRPCKHFGTCNLFSFDEEAAAISDKEEYQFVYQLDEIIANHIERIQA